MRLGELLVDADAISREELARALADQRRAGGQLGEQLVRRQAIGEPMLHYYLGVQRTLRRRELERFSRLGPLLRLSAEYCRQSPRAIAAALALLFLGTALTLTFPYLVKLVLDYQIHAGSAGRIAAVCAGAALLLAAGQLATFLGSRLVVALDVRFAAHLRRRLYAVLLRLHVTSLVRRSTGDWLTRLTTDVDNVVDRWEQLFLTFWKNLFAIALSCAIVGMVDPLLTLVVLALSVAMVLLPGRVSNLANPWLMRRRPLSAALVALAQEKLRGFKTLATFDARREALGEFGRRFDEYYRNDFRMVRPWNMAFNLRTVMGALLSGVILFAGGHAVLAGRYGVGDLMMLILTVGLLAPYVDEMMLIIIKTNDVKRYWLECCATLDMNVDPERFTGDAPDLVRVAGDVELDRLSFQYGERPVLRDLSLRLAARRSYALVGRSGAGKSTLLRLLLRELEPSRGRVLLGGRPLGDLSDRAVAANIAYIAQKPVLFQASAADNIRLGGLGLFGDVTAAQVEEAARRAGIHERILALPRGYDTMLGDGAEVLSGGERQRVAIARALLKAPALCLFDEPTAALDPDSERWVLETILSLTSHSTVVISTHNLALIRRVDEVLLLDGDQTRLVPPGAIDLRQLVALLERAPEGEPATAA